MLICYTDINECLINNGGCERKCTNIEGINSTTGLGYQCGCDKGYQLAPNNHDCNGMCVSVSDFKSIKLIWYITHYSMYDGRTINHVASSFHDTILNN